MPQIQGPQARRDHARPAGLFVFMALLAGSLPVTGSQPAGAHMTKDGRAAQVSGFNDRNGQADGVSSKATPRSKPVSGGTCSSRTIAFECLSGWASDDHLAALKVFVEDCDTGLERMAAWTGKLGVSGADLAALCKTARAVAPTKPAARAFFEDNFVPVRLGEPGFVTGYFEPAVAGSRVRSKRFSVPLYARPDDLVAVDADRRAAARKAGLSRDTAFARLTSDGALVAYPARADIEAGALAGRGLEIAFVESPLDAFFIHIQGSARLRLPDGSLMRLAYAAKNGQPYTAIGGILIARGEISREAMSMETLRAWLEAHPEEAKALMAQNRSFIFFREITASEGQGPVGAAGVSLSPGRSLAVDRKLHAFGTPIFVEADLPERAGGAFSRLMIAQDTGSAIVGPARGDIFFGTGEEAGQIAGEIRHAARFTVLAPRGSRLARTARGESAQ